MTLPLPSSPHWPPTRMMTNELFSPGLGPPRLQVVEAGVVAAELELDCPRRPIAVLGDDDLSNAGFLVGLVVLRPKKKHHDVRVLLESAAFAKVAKDWSLIWPLLRGSTQLGDRNHGKAQFSSQAFERTRDGGNLLDSIVVATTSPVHQLQ